MTSDRVARIALYVVIACGIAAVFLGGCAGEPPRPAPVVRLIQCGLSNYQKCAAHCAADDRGDAFIVETQSEVHCACRKPPVMP